MLYSQPPSSSSYSQQQKPDPQQQQQLTVDSREIITDTTTSGGAVDTDITNHLRRAATVQEATTTQHRRTMTQQPRNVRRIERFTRLPVWPVWNGVLLWIVQKIGGNEIAASLEHVITGRVCPNFYTYTETSPFIMLVHHCHTFCAFDPLRYIQRTFFPEGFPAHPHRGFITITYILHGGFVHRDSLGIKQSYGADPHHGSKHTQWLNTGRGILHEEMFDIGHGLFSRQELYQIWLNVPLRYKMDPPSSILLGGPNETPVVKNSNDNGTSSQTLIIAGTYQNQTAAATPTITDISLFHVTLEPGTTWTYNIPTHHETAFLYLRRGSLSTTTTTTINDEIDTTTIIIPVHHTAYFEKTGDVITLTASTSGGIADFMFLSGEPIREPCVASGSMVMTSTAEINRAYDDYYSGKLAGCQPWDHRISDIEWKQHVSQQQQQLQPR